MYFQFSFVSYFRSRRFKKSSRVQFYGRHKVNVIIIFREERVYRKRNEIVDFVAKTPSMFLIEKENGERGDRSS